MMNDGVRALFIEHEAKPSDLRGLDAHKLYVAVRVIRNGRPTWYVAVSPYKPASFVDMGVKVMFVAGITLGMAVALVEGGAEVVE